MKDKPFHSQKTFLEENETNVPTVLGDLNSILDSKLIKIEKLLSQMTQRQVNGVSAEFNALMDGYVVKANESQTYKAKYDHLQGLYDDLKVEMAKTQESNQSLQGSLEALNNSYKSLQQDYALLQKDKDFSLKQAQDNINTLSDERERLKFRVKQLLELKDQNETEINTLKSESVDLSNDLNRVTEEKRILNDAYRQALTQHDKQVEDLKAKLELKAREVEYKDALLNQLVKKVSEEDSLLNAMQSNPSSSVQETKSKPKFRWGVFRK